MMLSYDEKELVNVGYGSDVTIGELAKTIGEIVGFKGKIVFDPSKPNGTPKKLMDSSRLFATGWQPKTHLKEGISLAYADFLTNHSTKNN